MLGIARRTAAAVAAVVLLASLGGPLGMPAAAASSNTYYVDGKLGNNTNNGLTISSAFKTIEHATSALPSGGGASGWTIKVVGYADYVYRERPIPPGWNRSGTPSAPITWQAYGYNGTPNGYIRPIVSGADVAPSPDKTWSSATGYAGVYKTPWTTKPSWFGGLSGNIKTAVFQDTTTWLWEQTGLAALGSRAAAGRGGYWWDKNANLLYVATTSGSPAQHKIDVPVRSAFYFDGRSPIHDVAVRGFEVRHSQNGIAFADGVDNGTATDNLVLGNILMGITVSGEQKSSGPDPATGAVILRNEGAWNTFQAIKVDEGAVDAVVCDNDLHHNGLEGLKVNGPAAGRAYTGTTSDTLVCRNALHDNKYNPTGSEYNNTAGIKIQDGALRTTVQDNRIWGNEVGIHFTQSSAGMPPNSGTVVEGNEIWSNRRFGLNLFDGYNGSGSGTLISTYNLYWDNGIGVMVDRGTINKTLDHDTIWWNRAEGVKVGGSTTSPASITIRDSLITGNRSYGLWLVTGNTGTVSYTGLSGNAGLDIKGSPSTDHVNNASAGYASTSAANCAFLTIGIASSQYDAGPGGTPIGARWSDGFVDICSTSFKADILWLVESGITTGCAVDRYCPDSNVTRGQMAAFLSRALNLQSTSTDFFRDDDGTTFEPEINKLAAAGITTGCGPEVYCPGADVSRAQMASFLVRALELAPSGTDFFTDDEASSHEANINALAAASITTGCTPTTYCPKASVTRGQMAAFLHRAFGP